MPALDLASSPGNALRPANALYVCPDDTLAVNVWAISATVTVQIRGRLMQPDGHVEPIEVTVPATNGRAVTTTTRFLGEGWLMGLTAVASAGAPAYAAAYVSVQLARGLTGAVVATQDLLSGYVTANVRQSFPGSLVGAPFTGPGNIRTIVGTDPAANVEISETVPTGARWRFISMRTQLVADATVANRTVALVFDDGANVYAHAASNFNQTASQAVQYAFGASGASGGFYLLGAMVSTPGNILMSAGHRFRTVTTTLQAGDNWTPPIYEVEEWLDPQ